MGYIVLVVFLVGGGVYVDEVKMTDYEIVDDLMQSGKLNDKIAEWVSGDEKLWQACCYELMNDKDVENMIVNYRINHSQIDNENGG